MDSQLIGLASCLAAAACWSVAIVLFRWPISRHGARLINLAKNVQGSLLLLLTVFLLGRMDALRAVTPRELALAAASGIIGMALGDTALFAAVARIGAHRTLLFQTTVPVIAAVEAFLFQGERLTPMQALGALVILIGVVTVVASGGRQELARGSILGAGGAFALLAAWGQGTGIVIAKEALLTLDVLPVAVIRLSVAAVVLTGLLLLTGGRRALVSLAREPAEWPGIIGPAFLGTYLAILLMLVGVANAPVSLSAVLLSLTPVIVLFVEARFDRRPVSVWALVGTVVAVVGVAIVTLPSGTAG